MPLQSNWQQLLVSQIIRGTFFMHPTMAMGLTPQLERILSIKTDGIKDANQIPERGAFNIIAQSANNESFSVYDNAPKGSTAIFAVRGSMLKYGTWCDYGTMEIASYMREAINHENIDSIVLEFDSGGGSVAAIAPLLQVISEAKAQGKPVVAKVDMCCSAAYYVACACDWIVADNGISSEIGSIGVMISFVDMQPVYEKMGAKFHTIYATQSTDKNQSFDLALDGKYELIQSELLDPLAIGFQDHVKNTRSGKIDLTVPGIISGKTFFAADALKFGLIDEVGDEFTALNKARQMAAIKTEIKNLKFL